jgi:cytochrome c-type biogenesis protein CcsB
MEKKFYSFLFSTRLMAFLFIVFAVAMATGTFIESKYNTDTARILIYNSWWFEAIMVFFMINFIGNIKRYQLFKKEKWATLLLHLSFIFILLGAFITRYISYEGMMPIREGKSEKQFYSEKTFLTIFVDGDLDGKMIRKTLVKEVLFSSAPLVFNSLNISSKFNKIPFKISYEDFIMGAKESIKKNENGTLYLKLVEAGGGTRHEHFLKEGEVVNIHNILFALNKFTQGAINISVVGDKYTIQTPFEGSFMRMADKMQGKVTKNKSEELMMRSLYNLGDTQFVFPEPAIKGIKTYVSNNDYKDKNTDDALVLKISNQGAEKSITVVGSKGKMGEPYIFKQGGLEYTVFYGSKIYELPFSIKLNDFIASKYPGTDKSFSAFESKVTVEDKKSFDTRIYMNHVLDHKGYRFFQASFDDDQKGTILSVSHDFWGTWITYIGYFILFFAMMSIMFTKHSRFADLKRKLDNVKEKKAKLIGVIILVFGFNSFAQDHKRVMPSEKQIDSILEKYMVSPNHANQFGRLIIQDAGRMKPINTFSSELLRKVSHSDTYKKMNADQVFISMIQFPNIWYDVPMIYIKSGNDSIRKIIGIKSDEKYAKFINFFDSRGNYKLSKYLDDSYKAANPNQFEKDFIETDKKIMLMNSALSGSILKIFPVPNDENNKWVSFPELGQSAIKGRDSVFTRQILPVYFNSLLNASQNKNYKDSNFYLNGISKYQQNYGKKVMPSQDKITYEILYNKYDFLQKLPYWYLTAAILMMFFVIVKIFKENKTLNIIVNFMHIIIGILFLIHTGTLIARWYISGHAPWSNAYEAIVYVAWATMFFGLAFDIKSKLTVASSAFVAAMVLAAAYANWIDPEIANLQPVLNSYWLMIHVAVIVASYGPFALGMILGLVSLLLILFTNEKNKEKMKLNIDEITYINEMSLTIGLIMLTIGNFLGGQWANESWGRYWGWDPKETWALISIMVYAFVIHARFVPSLRGKWVFNLMSVYAFLSILFTYYGVNFHLTGLHSYASGEAKSLSWIWISLVSISILGGITYPSYKKYYKK